MEIKSTTIILISVMMIVCLQATEKEYPRPQHSDFVGVIPQKFQQYDVILKPDTDAAEWWAGAPSVVRDDNGVFWMACRMRTADAPRGLRGYEIRILKSADGIHFETVRRINRDEVPIKGFERPALLRDPDTGDFKLYACGPWTNDVWSILKFDDVHDLSALDPTSAHAVISPEKPKWERDITVTGYKDPFILYANGHYHCYVIGYIRRLERLFHFKSPDGETWEPVGPRNESILPLSGWHDFFVRPASVVPVGVGYLFFYEGSKATWYDPVYNVVTGVGFTFDLHNIRDLTPEAPLVWSSTPGHFFTWRYSHWMWVENELWVYAEVAKENDAHEIRLYRLLRD